MVFARTMWASRGGAALNLLLLTLICGKWGGYNFPSFSFSVNQLRRTLFLLRFFRGDGVTLTRLEIVIVILTRIYEVAGRCLCGLGVMPASR